jgi:hypothetical protein
MKTQDDEFWPSLEIAQQALSAALAIKDFVMERIPTAQGRGDLPRSERAD